MKITKEKLLELKACEDGIEWYIKNGSEDLLETLVKVNDYNPGHARWLFTKLMTREQNIKIAVYAAELVLPLFEDKYPNDPRPRKAIEAAKAVLKENTKENRQAAYAAYAASAAYAAYAAYAATAATAAASAASDASDAYAAYDAAASDAAYAASAASDAYSATINKKDIQLKIIAKAVRILEKE